MNIRFQVFESFGEACFNAGLASQVRSEKVDPFLGHAEQVIFDFEGVRSMNSSFCNALIANFIYRHPKMLSRIKFANCRSNLKILIQAAVDLGLDRIKAQAAAEDQGRVVIGS